VLGWTNWSCESKNCPLGSLHLHQVYNRLITTATQPSLRVCWRSLIVPNEIFMGEGKGKFVFDSTSLRSETHLPVLNGRYLLRTPLTNTPLPYCSSFIPQQERNRNDLVNSTDRITHSPHEIERNCAKSRLQLITNTRQLWGFCTSRVDERVAQSEGSAPQSQMFCRRRG